MLSARGWTITGAVCDKRVLSRVPVIRPEGPGCQDSGLSPFSAVSGNDLPHLR